MRGLCYGHTLTRTLGILLLVRRARERPQVGETAC